jgi:hypothetical protein
VRFGQLNIEQISLCDWEVLERGDSKVGELLYSFGETTGVVKIVRECETEGDEAFDGREVVAEVLEGIMRRIEMKVLEAREARKKFADSWASGCLGDTISNL